MTNSLDVLIAAAHESELAGLRSALGPSLTGRVRGLHVGTCEVGIGLPAATIGTMRNLRDRRPRALILLGSCGAYPAVAATALGIGVHEGSQASTLDAETLPEPLMRVVIPETLHLADAAIARSQAEFPDPMLRMASVDKDLADGLARFDPKAWRGALATTLGITTSNTLAHRIESDSHCGTENLEALGVALACESEHVPFCALLVVTNVVGDRGRGQWRHNHTAAAESGARVLLDWLEADAPGLSPAKS
jgi:nucleoside phosphorylase